MFKGIANYIIDGKIKQASSKVKKTFVEWNDVQSIVILVSSEQYTDSAFKNFVTKNDKKIECVVFHSDKISSTDCFLSINKKDLNILGLPQPELIEKIENKNADILICADFNDTLIMKSLTGLIGAKCKVGMEGLSYSKLFDISIALKGSVSLENYLKETANYLKMIKTK